VARALDVTLRIEARWHGTDGKRLLDRSHASIVEVVARTLAGLGWQVVTEYTFNHFGERGSVDVAAWHPVTRSLVIVEVKSQVVDLQDLFASLGRKARVVPSLMRADRGWAAATVSRVLVLPGTTANRAIVSRHAATFAVSLPAGSQDVKRWLRAPANALAGIWFISPSRVTTARQVVRVRKARSPASARLIRA
jgi:Holliday junction resolvase-like predicted endonuclease